MNQRSDVAEVFGFLRYMRDVAMPTPKLEDQKMRAFYSAARLLNRISKKRGKP